MDTSSSEDWTVSRSPIALSRCPRDVTAASANRAPLWPIPARFGNTPTARNPTHRAVTNATFTSGCVHGHRAGLSVTPFRSLVVSRRRSSADLGNISLRSYPTTVTCAPQFYIIRGISFVCRMSIQNLNTFDPFADAIKGSDDDVQDGLVHIRIQQRNGRKTLTTVQGLSSEYDLKKIVRACKKEFACNGTVIEHPEYGEVLQLQGDQRENICQWLTKSGLAKPDQLKVHGF